MTSHTPGPWLAGKPSSVVGWPVVQLGVGRLICNVNYVQRNQIDPSVPGDRAFNAESAANARLIAAAPDMLAALELAADYIKQLDGGNQHSKTGWMSDELLSVWQQARAAIAKAEGRP